ncbi:MAG: hypothetical protein AB7E49_01870 [Campylobacterales bacterium]
MADLIKTRSGPKGASSASGRRGCASGDTKGLRPSPRPKGRGYPIKAADLPRVARLLSGCGQGIRAYVLSCGRRYPL